MNDSGSCKNSPGRSMDNAGLSSNSLGRSMDTLGSSNNSAGRNMDTLGSLVLACLNEGVLPTSGPNIAIGGGGASSGGRAAVALGGSGTEAAPDRNMGKAAVLDGRGFEAAHDHNGTEAATAGDAALSVSDRAHSAHAHSAQPVADSSYVDVFIVGESPAEGGAAGGRSGAGVDGCAAYNTEGCLDINAGAEGPRRVYVCGTYGCIKEDNDMGLDTGGGLQAGGAMGLDAQGGLDSCVGRNDTAELPGESRRVYVCGTYGCIKEDGHTGMCHVPDRERAARVRRRPRWMEEEEETRRRKEGQGRAAAGIPAGGIRDGSGKLASATSWREALAGRVLGLRPADAPHPAMWGCGWAAE
jgi:hypothetical protein